MDDEELTYHESLLSFNDGRDFFEEVLGGMKKGDDSSDDDGSSDEEYYSSSESEDCGCKGGDWQNSDDESPFLQQYEEDVVLDDIVVGGDDLSPFIGYDETSYGGDENMGGEMGGEKEEEETSQFIIGDDVAFMDDNASLLDEAAAGIEDIQGIIGGMLRGF